MQACPIFTAFDPPRTLTPVSAMGPGIAVNPRPEDSDAAAGPDPAPVSPPELNQPKHTATEFVHPGSLNGQSCLRKPRPTQGFSPTDGPGNDEAPANTPNAFQPGIADPSPPADGHVDGVTRRWHTHTLPVDSSGQTFNSPYYCWGRRHSSPRHRCNR